MNINMEELQEELTDAFIEYQYRLENPMPQPIETKEIMVLRYRSNSMFYNRVQSLVCGVLHIVGKNINEAKP